jgi:hypothetical protein
VYDFLLGPAFFKTLGTQMKLIEFNITQGAQKTSAARTGDSGLFSAVIETTGFSVRHEPVTGTARGQRPERCRIHIRPHQSGASRAD